MSDLFPEMGEQLSPRLKWQEQKQIKTMQKKNGNWIAYKSETRFNHSDDNEVNAVIGLAKKLKLKLWNQ